MTGRRRKQPAWKKSLKYSKAITVMVVFIVFVLLWKLTNIDLDTLVTAQGLAGSFLVYLVPNEQQDS